MEQARSHTDPPTASGPRRAAKSVGLVGCGNWGKNILRDLLQLGCRVPVADIAAAARSRALEAGATQIVPRLEELPPCDGYVVAVPIPDLAGACARLLERDRPVFSEKTLCLSLEDCDRLETLGGAGRLFVMHKWHYHPGVEALREIAASGRIGELLEVQTTRHAWVPDFHGGDVFWTQAVHDLTIVRHIIGLIPEEVRAVTVIRDENGLPVGCTALLGRRPAALLSVSGRHCSKVSGVSVLGSRGAAALHDACDDHVTVRDGAGAQRIPIDTTFPLYLELKEFVEHVHGGPRPRCGLQDAREITRAILNLRSWAGESNPTDPRERTVP